ncbi:cobyrinic acid a,c-diamide synthase [Desulfuribacillus stibiiarsenatis]|uniref:Cobyrinic acid a,c-diamide synthase n=1 Tax=Desulfuribacillus stibiiarsenatis TaxID=1390249 RepID=A0A1E5L710_9FIRM|nr:MinD/ParA family protein [Desulfuribacillus stibiiarsenatis]OEH85838.1 cobyrinic acid a,c-diamide synthase [Desulfuribacillus stibiiarsenatis]
MNDQAARLRQLVSQNKAKKARVITVTSGKGGVGKSNFTLNFALCLKEYGKKVVILDADLGLANIDVLLGVSTKMNLANIIYDHVTIWDVLYKSEYGIDIVAGGSGIQDLLSLNESQLEHFLKQIDLLSNYADYILIDTGAGLSKETARLIVAADEVILVTTPEPTSITDAYAIVKMVHNISQDIKYRLIVNRVMNNIEGKATSEKLQLVTKRFLNIDLSFLGLLPDDQNVLQAVKKQKPFYLMHPTTDASQAMRDVTNEFLNHKVESDDKQQGITSFMSKMLRLLR